MKQKILAAGGTVAVAATALTGCSGGAAEATCTNDIVNEDATQVSVWAWYPAFEEVVDLFNSSHDDVQICWTNAGQGNDEYTKFSTAIEAGSGAPDVIMLESEVLSSFFIRDALVDLSEYGAADVEGDYTEGAWRDVSSGDAVYAIPVDGGPMGMLYRQDILDEYGIAAPTTWEEFAAAAETLKENGAPGVLANFPPNGRAYTQALFAQAGSTPFTYDSGSPLENTERVAPKGNDTAAVAGGALTITLPPVSWTAVGLS
ncbi:ABC transporter substrate-binding protein [Microbacterium sp. ZXX196]|uniref:ABC transporter substrate-binding protein n=1 Tax=Microbacterium sp. ZXX196 TaxID=2609291 RepID=UPI0012B9D897|nr:extracellular solute-binding protein [Microbacterium sp. ZXX196]MTE24759.1 extracellular solute-binding protein [Microbacterium sp. ZXX196]